MKTPTLSRSAWDYGCVWPVVMSLKLVHESAVLVVVIMLLKVTLEYRIKHNRRRHAARSIVTPTAVHHTKPERVNIFPS